MKIRLLQDKKGVNDVSILTIILFIFIGLGILLPFVNTGFNNDVTNYNTEGLDNSFDSDTGETSITSIALLSSILKMFFWTFGDLPFWLDGFFIILRLIFWILLYRQVRSGSG